jgi:lipoprotein-anchoring transpeptidase ErfK/SrfK
MGGNVPLGYDVKDRKPLKTIVVDKNRRLSRDNRQSRASLPSGTYKIKGVAYNPIYYYDPDKNFVQGDNQEKLRLPPGPNNPVGSVFIALTKPSYGLHGTPDPSKINKSASHGCVRMTNWDANELAHLVKRGIVVRFKS